MKIFGYNQKDTFIHNLSAVTKLIIFLLWSILAMLTYNTYILLFMLIVSIFCIYISKIKYEEVYFVLWIMIIFSILNTITIYIFSPQEGYKIYGTLTKITNFGIRYDLSYEQLFYQFNILLKYLVVAPIALIFINTTNPTELSAGLNKLGVPYSICYAINIAFRYIPDIQIDYYNIKKSKEARGIDLSNKKSLVYRIKNIIPILIPLIFSSIDRIETISTAMELREFGKNKKRTWYAYNKMKKYEYLLLLIFFIIFFISLYVTFKNGSRFYNPFK